MPDIYAQCSIFVDLSSAEIYQNTEYGNTKRCPCGFAGFYTYSSCSHCITAPLAFQVFRVNYLHHYGDSLLCLFSQSSHGRQSFRFSETLTAFLEASIQKRIKLTGQKAQILQMGRRNNGERGQSYWHPVSLIPGKGSITFYVDQYTSIGRVPRPHIVSFWNWQLS